MSITCSKLSHEVPVTSLMFSRRGSREAKHYNRKDESYGSERRPGGVLTERGRNIHSLCYNFTVHPKPRPGQPWCVVQGQVDGKVFLSYDCGGAKIQSMSPLGEEVKATKA
eukprot:bmy_02568T0